MDVKQLAIFACLNGIGSATLLFEVEQSVVEDAISKLEWGCDFFCWVRNILLKLMKEIGIQKLAQISKVSQQVLEATVKIQQFRSSNNSLFQFDVNKRSSEKQIVLETPEKPAAIESNQNNMDNFDTETESLSSKQEFQAKGKKNEEKSKIVEKETGGGKKRMDFEKQKELPKYEYESKNARSGSERQDSPIRKSEEENVGKKKARDFGSSDLLSEEDLLEQYEKVKKLSDEIISNTQDYFCTNSKENPVYCIRCLAEIQNIKNKKSQHARECGKGHLKYPTRCFVCDISLHPATVGFHIYKQHPK